jgi:hypothetical protein
MLNMLRLFLFTISIGVCTSAVSISLNEYIDYKKSLDLMLDMEYIDKLEHHDGLYKKASSISNLQDRESAVLNINTKLNIDYYYLKTKVIDSGSCGIHNNRPLRIISCIANHYLVAKGDYKNALLWYLESQKITGRDDWYTVVISQIKNKLGRAKFEKIKHQYNSGSIKLKDVRLWAFNNDNTVKNSSRKKVLDTWGNYEVFTPNANRSYKLNECKKYYPDLSEDNRRECSSGSDFYNGDGVVKSGKFYPDGYSNNIRKVDSIKRDYQVSPKAPSGSFSDLWGQYGGSILDSNTNSSYNNSNSRNVVETDTQPPVIRFNHSDSLSVNDKQATISGVIKDSSKITELLIKGKEVAIDENGNFSISRYIRLGRNTFDIVALDAFGNKVTKVITIIRQKDVAKNLDKPLDLPSFKGRRDENAVALIIGLDKYESIARAPWAESDASVFYDYAQQSLGIPADRITLITGNQSDRSGIYDSLDMWLPIMVEEGNSNVYVYFAGHGLATADGEQAYLIPYDGNLENLRRTAIPRKEVIDVLKDLKAKSVTLFMDTCYSGTPKGGNGTLVADSRGLRIVKKDNFSSLPKNFTIFSAASNQQTASSHPSLENGLFSYWMMRGLGGEADNNNDRKITNGELHKFINKNVKKAAALMGRKQNSQLVGDSDRVIASW